MVRVRANESVKVAMAKRIKTFQNKGGETSNPPTQREIKGGETSNPPTRREIGRGETPNPPPQREIVRGETPNPLSRREIGRGAPPPPQKEIGRGETPNPPPQREIRGGKTPNPPPPQREIGRVETPNPPPQREIGGGKTLNPPPPPPQREIGRVETPNPPTQREIGGGKTPNPPPPPQREIGPVETPNPPPQREIGGGKTPNPPPPQREIPNPPSPRGSESSVSMAKAKTKRRKTQNEGGETSNPPPPQKGTGGGETSNSLSSIDKFMTIDEYDEYDTTNVITTNVTNPLPPQKETGGREEIGVTIDPDLLDCSICTNPLCPPLYQCINGHIVCTSCWSKVQYKCPSCDKPIGTQNIALEKVLESIHLPCPNANLGCSKSVSYSQMQVHTDMCEFGPSLCPIPGCAHKAFSGEWRGHFLKDHRGCSIYYRYGQSCTVSFNEEDLYYTFLGPGKDLFLLVKEPIPNVGNVISLFYIDLADLDQNRFSYELEEWPGSRRSYKSPAVSIKNWKRGEVHGSSLLVSSRVSWCKFHVLINKERDVSSSD